MAVFSLLALGLAMAGQSARIERALIVVCAVASAGQNYAAADVTSPRSVAAYIVPPLFLALVVDRVVAVVRRPVLGDAERSVWAAVGRGLGAVAKGLGLVLLYLLRFALAPPSTSAGLRRVVLNATPLPEAARPAVAVSLTSAETPAIDPPPTKKAALLALYRAHPEYGVKASASKVAAELAPQAGLTAGTARAYLYAELEARAS
jgi:hypothetical protein